MFIAATWKKVESFVTWTHKVSIETKRPKPSHSSGVDREQNSSKDMQKICLDSQNVFDTMSQHILWGN